MAHYQSISQATPDRKLKRTVIISLVLHLAVLGFFTFKNVLFRKKRTVKKVYLFDMVNPSPAPREYRRPAPPPEKPKEKKKVEKKALAKPKPAPKAISTKKPEKKAEAPPKEEVLDNEMRLARPDFPFHYYEQQIIRAVERNWNTTPQELLGAEEMLAVVVKFDIRKNGQVANVSIVESSWNSLLDKLAIRAIETAKIPPIPGDDQQLSVTYRLVLKRS